MQGHALSDEGAHRVPRPVSPDDGEASRRSSYREILRTSALIGGASTITVCIGIVRTKAMALLLGPAGYGVIGAYMQVSDLVCSVAQMGINASGVRQVAAAAASNDQARVARTASVLERTSVACGLLGALALAVFATQVSNITFGNAEHRTALTIVAIAVFFTIVAGGQGALLQGMRRIADMARVAVFSGVTATVAAIVIVYFAGIDGVALVLVAVSAITAFMTWWYCRKIRLAVPVMGTSALVEEAGALLRLGLAFMASGLLITAASYAVRTIVLRQAGLEAAGIYYAAWTLGGIYLSFVLQALGADFYPRLVGVADDDAQCNRLVNEQAQVSMLLAIPGVLVTLTVAPLVVLLLYSASFAGAVNVLRWICLGMALRVLTWPLGYIVVAKNRQLVLFAMEFAWAAVNVALTWWCVGRFGVDGAGIAFFVSYLFHCALVYPVARWLSGFRWTPGNRNTAAAGSLAVGVVFCAFQWLPPGAGLAIGAVAAVASILVCGRTLVGLAEPDRLPRPLARLLRMEGRRDE